MEANDKVKDFYEKYDEDLRENNETLEFTRTKIIIARYLTGNNMEIADICGATGVYAFWLAGMGHKVHLLDLAQKHIDIAKQKSKDHSINLASYTCADARDIPFGDSSMDMVLLMGALYHLRSPESRSKCLNEAFRVLKPGGVALCTVICRYTILIATLKYQLFHRYGIEDIEDMLVTGMCDKNTIPMSYAHTPDEIISELSASGFNNTTSIAVEGIANAIGDNTLPKDGIKSERLLRCIELTESTPELLGISRNIIAVGYKP